MADKLDTKAINAVLLAMDEAQRIDAIEEILAGICAKCWSLKNDGGSCWACYESPAYSDGGDA